MANPSLSTCSITRHGSGRPCITVSNGSACGATAQGGKPPLPALYVSQGVSVVYAPETERSGHLLRRELDDDQVGVFAHIEAMQAEAR